MTTLLSQRPQQQQPPPAPVDQPTPVSPPFFMSSNHASEPMTEKYQQKTVHSTASPGNPVQAVASRSPVLTPTSSIVPNGVHDVEGDVIMDDSGWSNSGTHSNKRRRTSTSPERPQTVAPYHRQRSKPALPSGLLELISKPDVSPYHLVCQKQFQLSYPDPAEDLLQLYNLDPIVRKVQRVDAEGKKNKLRKSYKGFISHLSGKHDVQPERTQFNPFNPLPMEDGTEENAKRRLYYLSQWPEEDFFASQVHGKDIGRGFDKDQLRRGVAGFKKEMLPGFDQSSLALDDERKASNATNQSRPPQHHANSTSGAYVHRISPESTASSLHRINGVHTTPGTPVSGVNRPNRGKRRRYDESSYEGYEGYQDDDGGGAWKAKKKKTSMGMVGSVTAGP
ncbi:Rox3-domain-containing protein [Ascodesmis nigricans]|uniref:Mediator of RNA polymerase II transcription subunit 19 n=1 Tax=Ascodesmis nigricans TaxID=341454 RepID=A0A4S2N4K0_9PEZI|nr:Rox3-domain-containing protein [Ascodesmis nigricans]